MRFKDFFYQPKANQKLINEDFQSSMNQAQNILKNNGVENYNKWTKDLEHIFSTVRFESEEHRSSRSDQDIPALAFLVLAGYNMDRISQLYNQYCNTKSLYSKSSLIQWGQNIRNVIQTNKWFKPSPEKTKFIQEEANKLVGLVHRNYIQPENKTEEPEYEGTSEDVVFENDDIIVYLADSMDKCIFYGKGTNLCIAYERKKNYYWRYRLGKMQDGGMTTYFVVPKNGKGKEMVVIDAMGDEEGSSNEFGYTVVNEKGKQTGDDYNLPSSKIVSLFPYLQEPFDEGIFQFIEYGESEKRASEIDEDIESILDERLNGYVDYDIFVQLDKDIFESEWDQLRIDKTTKGILLKKYMGSGGLVTYDTIKKYGNLDDLDWYEDILSRNITKSIIYYHSANGSVSNEKIKRIYNKEKIRVDGIGKEIRDKTIDGIIDDISLYRKGLFFLPDLSDITVTRFDCSNNFLVSLKGAPRNVIGDFDCTGNNLKNLEGCPENIMGSFYCYNNQLASLRGSPQDVGGHFDCSNNLLTSLEGCPENIGGYFICSNNQLQSLEGAPKQVVGKFDCSYNTLRTLIGSPQKVGGYFNCSDNKLQSLEGAPQKIGGNLYCYENKLQSLEGVPEKNDPELHSWGMKFQTKLKQKIESKIFSENIKESFNLESLVEMAINPNLRNRLGNSLWSFISK